LKSELLNSPYELSADEKRLALLLHDLLAQIFVLDPEKRITPEDALRHPFFH
jgi:serine/threonine protein kinase